MLASWRDSAGLSQRELSKKLGHAPNYIGRIEAGRQGCVVMDLIDVASVLGQRPETLFAEYCMALRTVS
jgi:transcriptional regulator with XRE-family HTH domain